MRPLRQVEQVVHNIIVIGLEEFKWLRDAGHAARGGFYYGGEFGHCQLRILLVAVDKPVDKVAYTLKQLLIFEALR